MGGADKILAVKTLRIVGSGQSGYQEGGGNIDASPHAPIKAFDVNQDRTIDYANGRTRLRQRGASNFEFVSSRLMRGARSETDLDGDIAYAIRDEKTMRLTAAAAHAHRIAMLSNPVGILRAALDSDTKLTNLRRIDNAQAIDLVTEHGDEFTLAIDSTTFLPDWVSWVQGSPYLGDLTLRRHFSGYQLRKDLQLPSGYATVSDFKNTVMESLDVHRVLVDASEDALPPAPDSVRSLPIPADSGEITVEAVQVEKGIWYLKGLGNSTLFEFADHVTVFEPFGSEANMKAVLDKARLLIPGKPITQIIASHHHLDHNGGLRTAVAEGLEVIAHRDNVELLRELAARPARRFPDALGRNPKPIKIVPVDDKLTLKDGIMQVDVLRVMNNNHMAAALIAYAPKQKLVAQGDLFDEGWEMVWWGDSYADTVNHWGIDVDRDLAVHGNINPYAKVLELLAKQTAKAKQFCEIAREQDYLARGCPP